MNIRKSYKKVLNSLVMRLGYEMHSTDYFTMMKDALSHSKDALSHSEKERAKLSRDLKETITNLKAVSQELEVFSMQGALSRITSRTIDIETVIDIGASDGQWSREAMKYFPYAFYFLVEANKRHEAGLKAFMNEFKNIDYMLAAASDEEGEVFFYFNEEDPYGGRAFHMPSKKRTNLLKVPAITIDTQVKEKGLKPPFLIKLDTHGFEMSILNGAEDALTKANLLIIETYNFNISDDSLLFYQMCEHLDSKGFRCIDLCCPLYRPKDGAFWQCDLFFIPSHRDEFKSLAYF